MNKTTTLEKLLRQPSQQARAIGAPGREWMSYQQLNQQVEKSVAQLNELGIGHNDPVAIVLPNGPEMVTVFLSVASVATAAPLNPAYKFDEFSYYLKDLEARALIILSSDHPQYAAHDALKAAQSLGIQVLEVSVDAMQAAGQFNLNVLSTPLESEPVNAEDKAGFAGPQNIAMVLHTSGTTSRPKIVPLSQANICASAYNVQQSLSLDANDRGLVIMPLFHIHGLIAAVLAPLQAGGSIFCPEGFNALKFFSWMSEAEPTWYTAVPTMHQAILSRAKSNQDIIKKHPLRFIRSSSSALSPAVLQEIEQVFDSPLIEAYGMTEAAHQMACNPMPPQARKPGCVGLAAGPEVAIMDNDGQILATGEKGEIVIRGDNVTPGYKNNELANQQAFTHGWFRTGDQGLIDEQGYLAITGRLKEIINRGGEKISPREVDDVLMEHPAIEQVVTFAVPHKSLGEEVGAAIVLKEQQQLTDKELREYAADRLAAFKIPKKIIYLDEIPKGATGKLQRIGLAQKLGISAG